MRQAILFIATVALVAIAASASAASTAAITGTIYDDPTAIALPERFIPVGGVKVSLFLDDGDALPSSGDTLVATTTTDRQGLYSFSAASQSTYWIVVDSRTAGRGTTGRAWAEQTYGPAGALCAQPDGSARVNFLGGACIGGRRFDISDDASSITAAEHVARVQVENHVREVDFAFSFNVVSSTADDVVTRQGTLRQFIENANAIKGANVMRFVPVVRPDEHEAVVMQAETARWWVIRTAGPLPGITDDDTVIDGNSYSFLSPASRIDRNPGHAGLRPAVPPFMETPAPRQERPELEIITTGEEGLACAARCVIRTLAINGARVNVVTRADARVEHVMVGVHADGSTSDLRSEIGLQVEGGRTTAEHLLVEVQTTAGLATVGSGARVDARFLDIAYCGTPTGGAAVALLADGSSIRHSVLHQNLGAGILIGNPGGGVATKEITIEGNTLSRNAVGVVLSPGASQNTIARNMITWNRAGGVVAAPGQDAPPVRNVISENLFNENGLRPIMLNRSEEANALLAGGGECGDDPTLPNHGIPAPRITSVRRSVELEGEVFVIAGTACPGHKVEIYRSFVTRAIRKASEARLVRRKGRKDGQETLTIVDAQVRAVASIGEFNFVGSGVAAADGSWEILVPLNRTMDRRRSREAQQFEIWADEALGTRDPTDSAFSALGIDPEGNTSELSSRHALRRAK